MRLGIGFGAERIGIAALKAPRLTAVLVAVLIVVIGASITQVRFDEDIHRVFLSDSALSDAQRDYEANTSPPLSTVLVLVSAPQPFTSADMTTLRDLSLDLAFVDGVTSVASPFALRLPPSASAPSGTPLFGADISDSFAADIAEFRALGTGLPTFITPDLTQMLIGVSVDKDVSSVEIAVPAIEAELTAALPPHLSATITGEDAISAEIVAGLKSELVALNLWGAVIVALAAYVLLRDVRMAFLSVLPALVGAAGVLALSVWLGYPVTVLSNVIPVLLLVLGVADGVHLSGHYKATGSVDAALTEVGPACALTAITTAAAFASIMLTGNPQLFEFAVLGALGAMLSFAIVLVVFALAARWVPLSDRPLPVASATFAARIAQAGAARRRLVMGGSAVLLIAAIAGYSQTRPWFPLYQNLPDGSATLKTNDEIGDAFGGVFQMIVESDGDWAQTRAIATTLEEIAGPETVLSEVNIARWLGHPDRRPTEAERATLPDALVTRLRPEDGVSRLFVAVPEPMRDAATLARFDRLFDAAEEAGAARIFGLPTIMRAEAVTLIGQLSVGLAAAIVGATVLVAAAFRAPRLVPILLVPNLLPLMLTGASLQFWADGQLSPTAVLALTISFGIAIDDTVHFLNRYVRARSEGLDTPKALALATASAGQVMVITTVLLTAGLCVTLTSAFTPVRMFGGMMIITLWAALLTDLLLLPAYLSWKGDVHDPH